MGNTQHIDRSANSLAWMRLQDECDRLRTENERLRFEERVSRRTATAAIDCLKAPDRILRQMVAEMQAEIDAMRVALGCAPAGVHAADAAKGE